MRFRAVSIFSLATLALAFLPGRQCLGDEQSLAITDAGVEQAEDAPFVNHDYEFLPGDYVYFTFQVAGASLKPVERTGDRLISVSYEVVPQDAHGVPLTPAVNGSIQTSLHPEDKNWIPKRRASFLLPSYIAAGEYRIHIAAKDLFSQHEIAKDIPFRVGGVHIQQSASLTVEDLQFFRNENDTAPVELAAYSPGDTVFARFDIVGYKLGSGNEYRLSYGLTVTKPDGKIFVKDEKAAELMRASFYPAQFVPGSIQLTTRANAQKGQYVIDLIVRDLISNQTFETKRAFSIE
jgi:hypothetical protein